MLLTDIGTLPLQGGIQGKHVFLIDEATLSPLGYL